MYQYDSIDKTIVAERVEQFRDQVKRHLAGELSASDLQPLRLRNGLYMQIHAHMLRVSIPYGLLSAQQMRTLAHVARKYDRGYGHFTTRQNIQFNWPALADVPDILEDLSKVEMHSIQTSGNCIRNISSDHYAGVATDEIIDPRPYCEIIRQWSTLHPEFYWLPRKFKIAVTGATTDRAAVQFHDIGLEVVEHATQGIGFRVYVGGGLGRTPVIGKVIKEFLPRADILSYCEAVLRVYNLHGRRDNKFKARIKILVNALGIDEFRDQVEADWAHFKDGELKLHDTDFETMQGFFPPPNYVELDDGDTRVEKWRQLDSRFKAWYDNNTAAHRQAGYRIVNVSLKEHGVAPGDATDAQMDALADIAEQFSFGEIRVTHEQNLVLADVEERQLLDIWKALDAVRLATPNIGSVNDMICCPGLDFCSLANASSISIAKQINEKFNDFQALYDIGEVKLKMSGCMNACGHHHVGHIGILGVDKKGEEWYQLTVGGDASNQAALGARLGPAIAKDKVSDAIDDILSVYREQRDEGERLLDTFRRVGVDPFKDRVYAEEA
ncbi:nitrite/sulfite reductase [Arenicella xantha]|uniref:Sulfite reductase (NADPH) hemoprotein beta-component n=1 Tax=Arenicella xantha TaxID=644221 RepID=A0A395JT62_9GAMM|nr:nitrite/sulfite reductase [Arenicella xantha]RBP53735.1 sulfite reductase (NADPH) hemoprotein beta-component [Arenicella xantha]